MAVTQRSTSGNDRECRLIDLAADAALPQVKIVKVSSKPAPVEAIGRNSNLGHLCKKWAELRRRILSSRPRPASSGTPPRSKRLLGVMDVDDIVQKYDSGETTQQIGAHFGISKSRVATVLREQSITIRANQCHPAVRRPRRGARRCRRGRAGPGPGEGPEHPRRQTGLATSGRGTRPALPGPGHPPVGEPRDGREPNLISAACTSASDQLFCCGAAGNRTRVLRHSLEASPCAVRYASTRIS